MHKVYEIEMPLLLAPCLRTAKKSCISNMALTTEQ
jgi:hypothetical protein